MSPGIRQGCHLSSTVFAFALDPKLVKIGRHRLTRQIWPMSGQNWSKSGPNRMQSGDCLPKSDHLWPQSPQLRRIPAG